MRGSVQLDAGVRGPGEVAVDGLWLRPRHGARAGRVSKVAALGRPTPSRLSGEGSAGAILFGPLVAVSVSPVPAVPVHAQDCCVVGQVVAGLLEDSVGECSDRFTRVQCSGLDDRCGEVDAGGVAFEHAVGEEHQPVAGL